MKTGRRLPVRLRQRLRLLAAALLLRSAGVGAAAFVPGPPEADQPTGATGREEPVQALPAGGGIRWELAPLRYAGTVSLDGRWLRLEDGTRTTQGLVFNDIEFASYVWQPWFVQLRAGLGALATHDASRSPGGESVGTDSGALTGRFSVSVFPVSRFPFELRGEVSDSRVRGDTLGTDYRSHRLTMSQAWRPETGGDNYNLNLEYSRLQAGDGSEDTLTSLRGTALRQFNEHSFELSAQLSRNDRSDSDDASRITLVSGRHTFHPATALHVDTLASWNDVRLRSGTAADRFEGRSDVRQISSFATWRPREGEWLYSAESPLYLTGSARVVDAGAETAFGEQRVRAMNASLGASQELTREWRLSGSVSGSVVEPDAAARSLSATANAGVTWSPEGLSFAQWRYTPTLGASVGSSRSTEAGARHTLGAQAAHGVSRSFVLGETDSLSLNFTQSAGALRESQTAEVARALAHSASLFWQGTGDGSSQSYVGLSASDSRTWAQEAGHFQLINAQVTRRTQLSRHSSWTGALTWQATRADTTQLDAFTGTLREASPGWQRFYSGTLGYENQRVFEVPRLRFTTLLSVNSQQLESRLAGDIDAPVERISESLESRFDYSIGRLEARLSARLARVDGRKVAALFARVQRRY